MGLGDPDAHLHVANINPSNPTVVAQHLDPCKANNTGGFPILIPFETVMICPYENRSHKRADQHTHICEDDDHYIAYGPYKQDDHPPPFKPLHSI